MDSRDGPIMAQPGPKWGDGETLGGHASLRAPMTARVHGHGRLPLICLIVLSVAE